MTLSNNMIKYWNHINPPWPLTSTPGKGVTSEPVAMRIFLVATVSVEPSLLVTVTSLLPVMVPKPCLWVTCNTEIIRSLGFYCIYYSPIDKRVNRHTIWNTALIEDTVYPKKYAHGFVVLCFVVVMQTFIMNSHEIFIHIHQGCFAGTGAIVRLPQCQWSKPDGYGKISQCITTTKHSKAKTVCIFLGIYCKFLVSLTHVKWAYLHF